MLRRIALGFALTLLLAASVFFAALNRRTFDVDLAFLEFEVSSGLALLVTFAAGLLAGAFARARWVAELLAERGRLRLALRLAERRLGSVGVVPEPEATAPAPDAR
jgi:uncharacterized integral membrane protein